MSSGPRRPRPPDPPAARELQALAAIVPCERCAGSSCACGGTGIHPAVDVLAALAALRAYVKSRQPRRGDPSQQRRMSAAEYSRATGCPPTYHQKFAK